VQVRPGTWSIIIDGRAHVVDLERRGATAGAPVRGTVGLIDATLAVEDAARRRLRKLSQRGAGATGSGERIVAPIAGKIVKVLVAMGDTVAPGQAVIVVEAMKMENEITAQRGGVVTQLGKGAGAAVDTGELLLQLT
jgi:acetyl-CoA/propionyl-CoA carboxylase biotin carboxyl carrier protein